MDKPRIEWVNNDELAIYFNDTPRVCIRYLLPTATEEEEKSIKKYPFICKKSLIVTLFDKTGQKKYEFTIPKGYCYDGATIPRLLWRVIGSKTDNTFLIAALVHDAICENHHYVDCDRNFSSLVFRELLIAGGVGKVKAQIMYLAVDNFQRFCKW